MKPFSLDLRQRVVDALAQGQTQKQVAQRFDISLSSVTRWAKQWRETNCLTTKPIPGRPRAIDQTLKLRILELVTTQTNHTLATLGQALQQQGYKISKSVLHRELIQSGFSHKKRVELLPNGMKKSEPTFKK
jgi:transposase